MIIYLHFRGCDGAIRGDGVHIMLIWIRKPQMLFLQPFPSLITIQETATHVPLTSFSDPSQKVYIVRFQFHIFYADSIFDQSAP
ncbi:hypothetical protein VN97_g7032 [Penicillium thymicola]|uniref:Uncharacterized protein n=1 Tax=Penicillium thymicola TaxID=293382 RepID=A0AAI9X7E9_PENTH|nr:hypothetical protein VN97_g7032 [Penicillium thymicola]